MLRITKPGGFLFCFGGTRTFHRLTCAIEDAGWYIRDCMMWLYGSGFPKSTNISTMFDKQACREHLEKELGRKPTKKEFEQVWKNFRKILETKQQSGAKFKLTQELIDNGGFNDPNRQEFDITIPTTPLAQLWNGYGTALKPAWEPIIVAMKPLDGTFAHNAEKYGVAGLNIDDSRIKVDPNDKLTKAIYKGSNPGEAGKTMGDGWANQGQNVPMWSGQGRWPANLILDEEAGKMLNEQSKTSTTGNRKNKKRIQQKPVNTSFIRSQNASEYTDSGGASRFFYCAKTSRKERNMGMEDCEDKLLARSGGAQSAEKQGKDEYLQDHIGLNRVAVVKNNHPTVKPLALMKYLCTLLKMPSADQIILDPFMGSGTTGMACAELGIGFIGIEKEPDYCEISAKRIGSILGKPLPVSKNVEMFRVEKDFAGGSPRPNENLSRVSEHRQRIINAASAELHTRRNQK